MKRTLVILVGAALLLVFWHVGQDESVPEKIGAGVIICFGDSLTAGTGAGPGEAYPAVLAELIGREVRNAGIPGDTTATALARLEHDVLTYEPAAVLITLGGNDLRRKVPRERAFSNLQTIIVRLQEQGALVVVGGISLPLLGREYARGYENVCRDTGAVLVADVYAGILGKRELMSDQVHPNAAGYRRMAARFGEALGPYL